MWRQLRLQSPTTHRHPLTVAISASHSLRSLPLTPIQPTSFNCCQCRQQQSRSFHASPITHSSVISLKKRRSSPLLPSTASKAGGGGTRSRLAAERAAKLAAEKAAAEARHLAELRALEEREAALEAAAQEEAESKTGHYRRPHLKRRGATYETRKKELQQLESKAEEEAPTSEMDELEASLTPAERKRLKQLEREDAKRFGLEQELDEEEDANEEDEAEEEIEEEPERKRNNRKKPDYSDRVAEVVSQVRPAYEIDKLPRETTSLPTPLVAHVEDQLKNMDVRMKNGAQILKGTVGLDSINLSSSFIAEEEVFETVPVNAGMKKLLEQARKGDSHKRSQLQRIERATEKTKEIIGRVLLEESIKIGAQQQRQQLLKNTAPNSESSSTTSTTASKSSFKNDPSQFVDLRTTPSFRIHHVKYSTDLSWASVMWTLGKADYDASFDPNEPVSTYDKPTPRPAAPSPLPNWFVMRRRIQATLDHVLKHARYVIGKELDFRYTPNLRFTYDDLYEHQQEKERLEREHFKQQEEEMQKMLQMEADEAEEEKLEAEAQTDPTDPAKALALHKHRLSKSRVRGVNSASLFDHDAFMNRDEVAKDMAMEAEFEKGIKHWFLPKRKLAALVKLEKEKIKMREAKQKRKDLLAEARRMTEGISLAPRPEPLAPSTDPVIIRAHLRAELGRIARAKNVKHDPDAIKKLLATRAELTQLQQIQSLTKKAMTNPVTVLKAKHHRESLPHYPDNWRKQKDTFWRKTDGRTRSKPMFGRPR